MATASAAFVATQPVGSATSSATFVATGVGVTASATFTAADPAGLGFYHRVNGNWVPADLYRRAGGTFNRADGTTTTPPVTPPTAAWTPAELTDPSNWPARNIDPTQVVLYEDVVRAGDADLQAAINRVTVNAAGERRLLSLPNGTFYASPFLYGQKDGLHIGPGLGPGCRGITGSGRNSIVTMGANTATKSGDFILITSIDDAEMSNFQLRGSPQTGTAQYHAGLVFNQCPNAVAKWMYLRGASPGYANFPPGETFGINMKSGSDNATISDTEADGRNMAGVRVSASPFGWNGTDNNGDPANPANITEINNAKVYRCYAHHGVAGMLTFWETYGVYTEDYWCYGTGSGTGSLSATGINHEQSWGHIMHVRPHLILNGAGSSNTDSTPMSNRHFTCHNTFKDAGVDFTIVDPVWDKDDRTPAGTTAYPQGMITMKARDGYAVTTGPATSALVTPPKVIVNGKVLIAVDNFNNQPTGFDQTKIDPATYYAWFHV
jgi:hypothetical protein